MRWLDFTDFENTDSKFTARLSDTGGYITFSNSGKTGDKKYFELGIEAFIDCLNDIKTNHSDFIGCQYYEEKVWRELGLNNYTNQAAKAQNSVQTKPMFTTLSKIIMWANSPNYDDNNPEEKIILEKTAIETSIQKLTQLSKAYKPNKELFKKVNLENVIYKDKSIREFAKYVFEYFFNSKWADVLNETHKSSSQINDINFISHDLNIFKRLIAEFNKKQNKEALASSGTLRFFEKPIYTEKDKYYYFSNQWNGNGNYSLSFDNLKKYFENKYPDYLLKINDGIYYLIKIDNVEKIEFNIDNVISYLQKTGLKYNASLIIRFTASLLTKPFVILTGLSGSGKTKLAQAFVQWICADENQFRIVPVGADWTNREPLLGYPNALKPDEYVKPDSGVLELILQANRHPNLPHFLILDEMNLSHVERYFADFLSAMESKKEIPLQAENTVENGIPSKLKLPDNLFIIGTVNIDETTNMFSPKVLDRANTIEFRVTQTEMEEFLSDIKEIEMKVLNTKGANMATSFLSMARNKSQASSDEKEVNETLVNFFGELKKSGAEFGYRSASEIQRLMYQLSLLDGNMTTNQKLDIAIMQKLLPKLHGSRRKLCGVLETLAGFCIKGKADVIKDIFSKDDFDFNGDRVRFSLTLEKVSRMHKAALDNGFTSFAEA